MKKICSILIISFLSVGMFAQAGVDEVIPSRNGIAVFEPEMKGTTDPAGHEEILYQKNEDTVRVKLGKRGIKIMESGDGTSIEIIELDKTDRDTGFSYKKKFRGHWSGFEIGLNNLVTSDYSLAYPAENRFMELNTGKSWNININFMQYSLGFGTDKVGLVTGLGWEMNNYRFDEPLSIMKQDGIIVADSSYFLDPDIASIDKSKLHTSYLTLPLLLEFQVPVGPKDHRIHISAGVIGGVKLWSYTKVVYKDMDGNKEKNKEKGNDFNLSPLRYGVTARIGYRKLNLFANYYPVPLFEKGKGPELYPFSIGLCLAIF